MEVGNGEQTYVAPLQLGDKDVSKGKLGLYEAVRHGASPPTPPPAELPSPMRGTCSGPPQGAFLDPRRQSERSRAPPETPADERGVGTRGMRLDSQARWRRRRSAARRRS